MATIAVSNQYSQQSGVGMVEILVAMVVVAVGVLGLGALQLQATRASGNSAYYSQAVWVVNDIVNRMQALRPENHDEYTQLIQEFNTANQRIFQGDCNQPQQDCATGNCTTLSAQIEWDFWDAGCPSFKRRPGEAIRQNQTLQKPLDWFNSPKVTVSCTPKSLEFYLPSKNQPANGIPDCNVELKWDVRRDTPEAVSASDERNTAYYSIEFELGRNI